jgi:hypothetical protein
MIFSRLQPELIGFLELLFLVLLFPIISFILIFGELMVIRRSQKKILELLKLLAQNRGIATRSEDNDDAI